MAKIEKEDDERYAKREAHLVNLIEAIDGILQTTHWKTLKAEVFDDLVATLERLITSEAKAPKINVEKIYGLQGQLMLAKKYADLKELANVYHQELKNIKQHGK